jgi:hypothetical protein
MKLPPKTIGLATAVLAIVAIAVAAAADAITSSPHSTDAAATVITVSPETEGKPIPAGFLGISMEFRGLEAYLGADPKALNPVFEQLLRNIAPNQRGVLRIGGDSTDWTWWPVPHMRTPGGVRYSLNRDWMAVAKSVAQAADMRLILGINLEANSSWVADAEARAMLGQIGRGHIAGLEIGNEPELYGSFSWFKTPAGTKVYGRPHDYSFTDFLSDYASIASTMPGAPLAGPSTGSPTWIVDLGQFLAQERRVGMVTLHRYPLKRCEKTTVVTIGQLLASASSAGLAESVAPSVALAHARHLPLRIDELNAVSCGGARGVSDTFSSALWAVDALFEMARVGVDGVNFHTVPKTINELISATNTGGTWSSFVHPQYYGMMLFAQAAPPGSWLLHVTGASGTLRAWATRAPNGQLRVVLINDDPRVPRSLAVRLPGKHGSATMALLRAPSLGAKAGVTLGGQSFGARTTTGRLAGKQTLTTVKPSGSSYSVQLPAGSAGLLTVSG